MITICEYLITKKNAKTKVKKFLSPPKHGCDVKDVCNWLESYGINKTDSYLDEPKTGELCYSKGMGNDSPATHWACLHGKTTYGIQKVVVRTKETNSNFVTDDYDYEISFEEAIEKMKIMIEDPNKRISV